MRLSTVIGVVKYFCGFDMLYSFQKSTPHFMHTAYILLEKLHRILYFLKLIWNTREGEKVYGRKSK